MTWIKNYKKLRCILPLRRINIFGGMLTDVFPVSLVKSRLLAFPHGVPNIFIETLTRLSSSNHYFLKDLDRNRVQERLRSAALEHEAMAVISASGPAEPLHMWHLRHFQCDLYFSPLKTQFIFYLLGLRIRGSFPTFTYLYGDPD